MGGFSIMGKETIMDNNLLSDLKLVGYELLDAQHKIILSHLDKIYTYLLADNKGRDLFELLDCLDINCKLHFLDEEKVMEAMDFPEIEEHKVQHSLFVTRLGWFIHRHVEMNCDMNIDELLILKGWSLDHFETLDGKYAEYKKLLINERICSSW
jgi:hemerythrin-like metal-binding protein